jgi:hypothetical protein
MREPTRSEDATNLSLIAGSAVVAVFLTLGLVAVPFLFSQRNRIQPVVEVQPLVDVKPLVKVTPVAPVAPVVVASYAGNDRLYGTVVDRWGRQYTGYIRWDRNEGSWADQLDATKVADRRRRVTSGIRFGHVESIEVLGRERARLTLKSGDEFVLGSNATDLGTGLRALVIETPGHGAAELEWRELGAIDFMPAPDAVEATEQRIHGTLTTRAGQSFTGYVAWDRDEIYTTDVLDGEHDGYDREIPFGEISAIERHSSSGARVVLQNGEEMILRGTNDVDDSNRGITVSDAGLGQVDVTWDEFAGVPAGEPGALRTVRRWSAHSGYGGYGGRSEPLGCHRLGPRRVVHLGIVGRRFQGRGLQRRVREDLADREGSPGIRGRAERRPRPRAFGLQRRRRWQPGHRRGRRRRVGDDRLGRLRGAPPRVVAPHRLTRPQGPPASCPRGALPRSVRPPPLFRSVP